MAVAGELKVMALPTSPTTTAPAVALVLFTAPVPQPGSPPMVKVTEAGVPEVTSSPGKVVEMPCAGPAGTEAGESTNEPEARTIGFTTVRVPVATSLSGDVAAFEMVSRYVYVLASVETVEGRSTVIELPRSPTPTAVVSCLA